MVQNQLIILLFPELHHLVCRTPSCSFSLPAVTQCLRTRTHQYSIWSIPGIKSITGKGRLTLYEHFLGNQISLMPAHFVSALTSHSTIHPPTSSNTVHGATCCTMWSVCASPTLYHVQHVHNKCSLLILATLFLPSSARQHVNAMVFVASHSCTWILQLQ